MEAHQAALSDVVPELPTPGDLRATTKVVHVTPVGERGGQEVVLLNLLRRLDRERFMPMLVFLADGPFVAEVKREGIETRVIPAGRVRHVMAGKRAITALARLLRDRQISLVHTWGAKAHLYGGIAAAIAGVKSVHHVQTVPGFGMSRDGLVNLGSLLVPADATIACSEFVANKFKHRWRRPRVVHNGTELPSQGSRAHSLRTRLGIPEDAFVIVMAGRLQRWKGVHVLVEAAAHVLQHHQNVYFVIVGGALFGLEREYPLQLERRSQALGIEGAVRFVGFQVNVGDFFQSADIVVHCSIDPEAFGMVLVEAMAYGKPVIATDSGGPAEVVQDGVTGFLVPPGDVDRLADAMHVLLDDAELRRQMGVAGAARVRQQFTAERMARGVERVYERVLGALPAGDL